MQGENARRKPRRHLEDDLQMQVAHYLTRVCPDILFFAVPNGGKRNPREAARLKAMGVLPGVADLLLFWSGGAGAIELKVGRNNQSIEQYRFMQLWQSCGGRLAVCRSLDEVRDAIRAWGAPCREATYG